MLTLRVQEKHIENLTPEEEFIRGTVGAECQIDLDEFWQGYENTVVFKRENDCTVYNVAIDSLSNRVEIPYTILAESGSFKVGLFGVKPDEVLPTLWSDYIKVRYGTDTHGTTPPKYEPNEIDQLRLSKQDKLTAGDGITIDENNVISASGGVTVDQTYNAESENAQSGIAVAQVINSRIPKVEENDIMGYPKAVVSISDLETIDGKLYPKDRAYKHLNIDDGYSKIFLETPDVSLAKGFIATRDSTTGNLWTGTPIDDVDCANKKYVDDKISAIPSGGAVDDVQINGESTVTDGIANIPIATNKKLGVIKVGSGLFINSLGNLIVYKAEKGSIDSRNSSYNPIVPSSIDYAVKAAMCDGKGAAWTDTERIAALLRMGCTVDENGFVKWTAQEVAK